MNRGFADAITHDIGSAGGTISGDVTIDGDLTVNGGGGFAYSEVLTGDMKITNTAASTAFEVEQNTGTGTAVLIDQNTNAIALNIDHEGTNQQAINVTATNTTGDAVNIDADSLTTANALRVASNSSDTNTRNVMLVHNDNASANMATALKIQQDAPHNALVVRAENTADWAVDIQGTAHTTAGVLYAYSNASNTSTRNLVEIHNDHASATGTTALKVQQDSTGSAIESLGRVKVKSDGTDEHSLDIRSVLYVHKADGTSGGMLGYDASENLFSFAANNSTNGMNFITHNGSSWGERLRIHTNGNVGIGTSSPMNKTQINHSGADGDNALMLVNENTTVAADACLGIVGFDSADGNIPSSGYEASGYIAVIASENHSTTNKGGHILFGTTADGDDDDTTSNERMRITAMGNVEIGKQKGSTSTDTDVTIYGGEAGGAILGLYADNGDDNADKWQLVSRTNNNIALRSYSTGSWVYHLQLDANSRISLSNNDAGTQNTVFGHSAGLNIDAGTNYNTFIGYVSAGGATLDDATNNTAVGYATLNALTQGDYNTAIGTSALSSLTTGEKNIAIGFDAAKAITTAHRNIAIGYEALRT